MSYSFTWGWSAGVVLEPKYDMLRPPGVLDRQVLCIWKSQMPSEARFLLWLMYLGKVLTQDDFLKKGVPNCQWLVDALYARGSLNLCPTFSFIAKLRLRRGGSFFWGLTFHGSFRIQCPCFLVAGMEVGSLKVYSPYHVLVLVEGAKCPLIWRERNFHSPFEGKGYGFIV